LFSVLLRSHKGQYIYKCIWYVAMEKTLRVGMTRVLSNLHICLADKISNKFEL
jgi:hypothetical protein